MPKLLLEADFSQVEIRVVTHLSGCKGLADIFYRGGDPHTDTAAKIFGLPYDIAKQEKYRYPTKRMNFGVIFDITPEGLAADIEEHVADIVSEGGGDDLVIWSVEDCSRLINDWNRIYPEISDFRMEQVAYARRYGYVKDMFGRIRFVPEVYCPIRSIREAGARQAGNMPVQSSAQGIIKLAMAKLFQERNQWQLHDLVRFLLQIHDSLLLEVDDEPDFVLSRARWLRNTMCGVVKLSVPLEVDVKSGYTWADMKKLDLGPKEE